MSGSRKQYKALGWWHVTTEGDYEGRSVHDLGTHYGYLDDIAFALGGKSYYSLNFSAIDDPLVPPTTQKPVKWVSVVLDIDSGLWDKNYPERAEAVREILKDRPVVVKEGNYYASVILEKPSE
jgi:hypothetical protein